LTAKRTLRSKKVMGTIHLKYCNHCKKAGGVTEFYFMTSAQKRSSEYRHTPIDLCAECASETLKYLDGLNKYKCLGIDDVSV